MQVSKIRLIGEGYDYEQHKQLLLCFAIIVCMVVKIPTITIISEWYMCIIWVKAWNVMMDPNAVNYQAYKDVDLEGILQMESHHDHSALHDIYY